MSETPFQNHLRNPLLNGMPTAEWSTPTKPAVPFHTHHSKPAQLPTNGYPNSSQSSRDSSPLPMRSPYDSGGSLTQIPASQLPPGQQQAMKSAQLMRTGLSGPQKPAGNILLAQPQDSAAQNILLAPTFNPNSPSLVSSSPQFVNSNVHLLGAKNVSNYLPVAPPPTTQTFSPIAPPTSSSNTANYRTTHISGPNSQQRVPVSVGNERCTPTITAEESFTSQPLHVALTSEDATVRKEHDFAANRPPAPGAQTTAQNNSLTNLTASQLSSAPPMSFPSNDLTSSSAPSLNAAPLLQSHGPELTPHIGQTSHRIGTEHPPNITPFIPSHMKTFSQGNNILLPPKSSSPANSQHSDDSRSSPATLQLSSQNDSPREQNSPKPDMSAIANQQFATKSTDSYGFSNASKESDFTGQQPPAPKPILHFPAANQNLFQKPPFNTGHDQNSPMIPTGNQNKQPTNQNNGKLEGSAPGILFDQYFNTTLPTLNSNQSNEALKNFDEIKMSKPETAQRVSPSLEGGGQDNKTSQHFQRPNIQFQPPKTTDVPLTNQQIDYQRFNDLPFSKQQSTGNPMNSNMPPQTNQNVLTQNISQPIMPIPPKTQGIPALPQQRQQTPEMHSVSRQTTGVGFPPTNQQKSEMRQPPPGPTNFYQPTLTSSASNVPPMSQPIAPPNGHHTQPQQYNQQPPRSNPASVPPTNGPHMVRNTAPSTQQSQNNIPNQPASAQVNQQFFTSNLPHSKPNQPGPPPHQPQQQQQQQPPPPQGPAYPNRQTYGQPPNVYAQNQQTHQMQPPPTSFGTQKTTVPPFGSVANMPPITPAAPPSGPPSTNQYSNQAQQVTSMARRYPPQADYPTQPAMNQTYQAAQPPSAVHPNFSPGSNQPQVSAYPNQQAVPRPQPQPTYHPPPQQTYHQPQQYAGTQSQQNAHQYSNLNQQFGNLNVTQSGFNRLWGAETFDLLQNRNILPPDRIEAPRVSLAQEALNAANCHPDIFRCTMTKIPESSALLNKSRLPLGVLIQPFRDLSHLPVIQCATIVRCRACRTYINPFVYFVDQKRWKCNLCYRVNELPEEFQYDPVSKSYGDPSRRPEIKSSTIEYMAPQEYMIRPPQSSVYLFLLDVSCSAIESGYLKVVCDILLDEMNNIPGDKRSRIGFICYNSSLHFYSMEDGLSQPHEMTVMDVEDIFLPSEVDTLMANLRDRRQIIRDLLNQLPNRFLNSHDNGSALGPALQAALKLMTPTGGRVTVFQCVLPTVGPGTLVSREDPSQRASTEVAHLNPATDFYKRLALDYSAHQIGVDLFILNSQYVDLSTLSGISRFSAGSIHHYPLFKATRAIQVAQFESCLRRYLTRKLGLEAVMRIRCTRGLSIHTFHGNFFVRSTDLLTLPNCNPDAGFGMQIAIDENLSDLQSVCFQAALLYTSSKGERRIRVHTLCMPIASTLTDVLNSADQQCIVGLVAKMAVDRSFQFSLSDARDAFINVVIDVLSAYKLSLNQGSSSGTTLLAPGSLKLLPLYIVALLKYVAFRTGTSTRLDDRVNAMCQMKTLPLVQLIQNIYPDLYPIHDLTDEGGVALDGGNIIPQPPRLQLSAEKLSAQGAFLLDCGEHMMIYVGHNVHGEFLHATLGFPHFAAIPDECFELARTGTPDNDRLHMFINSLNDEKPYPSTIQIIRDNSPLIKLFTEKLIEDRIETALSYYEFLQHLQTHVK